MEPEKFTPQIPPEPTPKNNFSKIAVICGAVLVVAVVAGAVFYFSGSKPKNIQEPQHLQPSQQIKNTKSQIIIFGDIKVNEEDIYQNPTEVLLYSVDPSTKEQKQLFTVSADQIGIYDFLPHIQFCSATNKIYIRTSRHIDETPYQDLHIKEIDLDGNIRNLDFTGTVTSNYKNWEHDDTGFALSKDCQKIVWSTTYYQYTNHQETGAVNEIVFSDINGNGKKVLLTTKKSDSTFGKELKSWSDSNPNIIYLTNYDWTRNGRGGGLFQLDLTNGSITQNNVISAQNIVWDISDNDNLVAHQQNFLTGAAGESFITNLANKSTVPLDNKSNGKRKFSPDNSKLADTMPICSGTGAEAKCVPNLYLFDLAKTNKLVASGVELKDWLTNNSVVGSKDDKDLVLVNINEGTENISKKELKKEELKTEKK